MADPSTTSQFTVYINLKTIYLVQCYTLIPEVWTYNKIPDIGSVT